MTTTEETTPRVSTYSMKVPLLTSGRTNQVLARITAGRPPSPTMRRFGGDAEMDRIIFKATRRSSRVSRAA